MCFPSCEEAGAGDGNVPNDSQYWEKIRHSLVWNDVNQMNDDLLKGDWRHVWETSWEILRNITADFRRKKLELHHNVFLTEAWITELIHESKMYHKLDWFPSNQKNHLLPPLCLSLVLAVFSLSLCQVMNMMCAQSVWMNMKRGISCECCHVHTVCVCVCYVFYLFCFFCGGVCFWTHD